MYVSRLTTDYHLFREHELDHLVNEAARDMPRKVVKEAGGWEKGNWWGIWRVHCTSK